MSEVAVAGGCTTITAIAAELGVSEATLSAWCKAAGVPIRHRKPGSVTEPPAPGVETSEQELARLRAEVSELTQNRPQDRSTARRPGVNDVRRENALEGLWEQQRRAVAEVRQYMAATDTGEQSALITMPTPGAAGLVAL